MRENGEKRRVALACQGGGSHTAFTAGVLKRILKQAGEELEIVALSGTSGGAICALLTWYGLLLGSQQKAIELLDTFWRDNSATSCWDSYLNNSLVWASRLSSVFSLPEVSPYFYPNWGQQILKQLLKKHVRFDKIGELLDESSPVLIVGAVNVLDGRFKVFKNAEITLEAILASAAIPILFRAVRIGQAAFWDGLFTQNPPIRDLPDAKPDEIWVIQIEPPARKEEPKSVEDIRDRRTELSGNLSLEQEIHFIEKINQLLQSKLLIDSKYKPIEVKRIMMLRELDYSSKIDRSPSFIQSMMAYGETEAETFLKSYQ
ncbi:putative esterase of the alpha-beta hydrolase superfamily [Pleurocapsa sp. PCC 7327]|uniref:patatin-like phospholipase family protein n=1 Tax=Pleurocapsa sp. PCC 7327 TaxID=118163 RepID=UPI00029FCE93|nr:patatin-like phospholipase family protein [Pleurocapsa sp. PCC 7327]AFY79161.1 putative esterase of the alpha-beta hydrolase superfamily [Pleurocapsa sp. PCC 7327]